ncbi:MULTISPECIES: efflux RND transporter permease subunit [Microvirgula]|uniref:Efflux pump membrane transporter n=1 Tax=Microvirgula aerodenitrificans TaxID=57480 RepID=A0A2S0PB38_9NEIS|nr:MULTISPECIES: efflux RND transporter permease subunit [Microvirgula]AVY94555.1 multidrug efflux RND transporter permease subunit [Microvirgula aerodenitrificans]RAS19010.1 multidrug efflux pump [Microvirgula sp. AG722]
MAKFFIDRPIFAWVIALVIMLAGALSILKLPVSQYPSIAPPSVTISANYPGASAQTLQDTVTQVIEQQMKGIDHLTYMSSTSDSSGSASITLTFDAGTDPDIAQVQVQNKLSLATPLLPQEVQRQGISVSKSSSSFLMVLGFVSEDGSMSGSDLTDYVVANLRDPISRVNGVGTVQVFGSQYAMRVWLDPNRLDKFRLTPSDIATAITAQNAQISAGQLGGTPSIPGQQINATITAQTRLQTAEQFEQILLRVQPDGSKVLLKDVARVEIGSESYDTVARFNGKPAAGVGIQLATGANALDTASALEAKLAELQPYFPAGTKVVIPYDTTPFVKVSIHEVIKTLGEAIVLVFLVMYLFLQNWRATLIPTIAVPVVLLGTFGVLAAAGFSINMLTMFAMVLAIGLLVDDAIVVVENVERVMSEDGLSPREATRKSMGQITGALVGIALVLSAVFVPMAFFGGSTGVIYRQFSITIVSAMVLSVLVAMILTPALCATLLKPVQKGHHIVDTGFFGWFNRVFDTGTQRYQSGVRGILGRSKRFMLIYGVIIAVMALMFMRLPTSFLPDEDQGILFSQIQLPAGATQERTLEVIKQVEQHFMVKEKDAVSSVFAVAGFSFSGNGQNNAIAFVSLKDWDQRDGKTQSVKALAGRAMGAFSQIKDAMVFAFAPPAVVELGNATGFDLQLQDRGGLGHDKLMEARNQLLGMAAKSPALAGVRPNGQEDTPQLRINIDQQKATAQGLSIAAINDTLSSAWGGAYVNDFIDRGRVKKVYLQADAPYRMVPEDLNKWFVRNTQGDMVPFSSFATASWEYGSPRLERYNGVPSLEILGEPAPGKSSGEAMQEVEDMIAKLPPGIGYEWTGLSFQERMTGSQAPALYAISLLVVFLCLAALYESWSIPFAVMLSVPLGVVGAVVATSVTGLSNDVYFKVGLLTTIGLAAKNAILIVEFAKELYEGGMGLIDATLEAVRMRLRPILMTSLAFTLGVLPLAINNGAGSGAQNAIGTGVVGGMISATVLVIFLVPLFFVLVRHLADRKRTAATATEATPSQEGQ